MAMYALVKFIEDGIIHICLEKEVKTKNGIVSARYLDGKYYPAMKYCLHASVSTLKEIQKNLTSHLPKIIVRHEIPKNLKNRHSTGINVERNDVWDYIENSDCEVDDPYYEITDEESRSEVSTDVPRNKKRKLDTCDKDETENNLRFDFNSFNKNREVQYFEAELNEAIVPHSKTAKKYFCFFCSKMIAKFPRHIETLHRDEARVREFSHLPKNSAERIELINKLRKEFLFIYNTDKNFNQGTLIPSRQPQKKFGNKPGYFKVCPECKGFYAKSSFRRHYRKCCKVSQKGERNTFQKSRNVLGKVHKCANDMVRTKIIPVMRDDECVRCIRYDELAITYANKLTEKYRSQHHCLMIRSRLRLIGRLLIEMKNINNSIQNFSQIFSPKVYDAVVVACNRIAGFNTTQMKYRAPATAFALGTLLKKSGKILINMCIKDENEKGKTRTEEFLKILEEEFSYSINKTVQENQITWKRQKKVNLPSLEDIKKLNCYLKNQRKLHFSALQKSFNYINWKKLSECTLTSIQVFNRRRPGEIERILIDDYKTYESVDIEADKELFSQISENLRQSATVYVRFSIRGKLGRDVPVLLNRNFLDCIKILLKYRTNAGVLLNNPYLFALPGENNTGFKYLSACNLLRNFAYKCGADKPHLLKATELRKHIATRSIMLNLQDQDVSDLARFMGHEKRIHDEHYRLPVASRDILKMSTFLENAQGGVDHLSSDGEFIAEKDDESIVSHAFDEYTQPKVDSNNCHDDYDLILDDTTSSIENGKSRKRSSSPKGCIKRRSWGQEVKKKIMTIFKEYIDEGKLPSIDHCANIIKNIPQLGTRSPVQLKTYISNQIRKNNSPRIRKRRSTIYWTEEDRDLMNTIFAKYLSSGKMPSLQYCQKIINNYPQLQMRTKETVKAWVNNQIKRSKRS